jgi:phosphate transport system substrate-binding protein
MNLKNLILGTVAAATLSMQASAVTVKGSDTMLIMNQRLAEAFGEKTGGNVNVTGGGSSIGITSFINGVADIAAASRPIRAREIKSAQSRNAIANVIPVALDGLAIGVHKDNPVKSLSMDQLREIYIGKITNWSQVGGNNAPIVVFSRDSNSGTYGFFQQVVLKNQNWGKGVRFMPSTQDEIREVTKTPAGIAYGGVAYFKNKSGVKVLPVSPKAGSAPIAPTEDNVRSKKYPIWRYLYFITNGKPSGETKKYVDFTLSAQGQKIIEEVGYYSVK